MEFVNNVTLSTLSEQTVMTLSLNCSSKT